jgi:Zn-dependent membrane protease YugP
MYFDPMYLMFALPGLALALLASMITKMTFKHYSEVGSTYGLTGAQAAKKMLTYGGINNVEIEETSGFLSDHYDPISKKLRLSPSVYGSKSLAAIGVACHEAGHAMQHAQGFAPLHLRTALVPATNISSWLSYIVITLGFIMHSQQFILLGAIIFSAAVLFSIVTLPVEWDASRRAKLLMVKTNVVTEREAGDAGKVLNAAFMTYVAAAVSALLTLLYYLIRAGVFSRRD